MKKKYDERRAYALQKLGGQCTECASTSNLEVDHMLPLMKNMPTRKFWRASNAAFEAELRFCQLLCRDCHNEKTSQEKSVGHGGGKTGVKGCHCEPCKTKKSEYNSNYSRLQRYGTPMP